MFVLLIKGNKIYKTKLPDKVIGNYWIKDINQNGQYNLINISSSNGDWILNSNDDITIIDDNKEKRNSTLRCYNFYLLKNKHNSEYILLYCCPICDNTYTKYSLSNTIELIIGKSQKNHIYYNTSGIDEVHATIINKDNKLVIIDNDSRLGVYVNDKRISKKKILQNGDIIFIVGLKIIVCIENNEKYLLVNNPDNLVKCRLKEVSIEKTSNKSKYIDIVSEPDEVIGGNLYKKNDYFFNRYRTKNNNDTISINIKDKKEVSKISMINYYVPIFIGIMLSISLIILSVLNKIKGGIVISILLLITMLICPFIIKRHNKKVDYNNDSEYEKYINDQNEIIEQNKIKQRNILIENNKDIIKCEKIILSDRANLWERKLGDEDFLNINLGIADLPINIDITSNTDYNTNNILKDVPFNISLMTNKILGIVGITKLSKQYIRQIILQLSTLHRYDELKIVVLAKGINKDKWDYIRILPHLWSNDKKIRMLATNDEEVSIVCNYLYSNRNSKEYYVLITDDIHYLYKNKLLNEMSDKFSVVIINENLNNISSLCSHIILLNETESTYYENKLNGVKQQFKATFKNDIDMYNCSKILANIPIDTFKNELPSKYTFMQMYEVGNIQQLNIYNRWHNNNSELSLKAKVGIDIYGEKIDINLHKNYDGTHLLIEGIPGSGKTEFLTTYILSMAINYDPKDVQFIIMSSNNTFNNIFYNENIRLPHLVGVVDYDSYTLKRFMTTLKSELIKRRTLFNKVSQNLNLDNMDIYTYQQLYHNKLALEPISHIFIIIDEYEELEKNHPKFINNLLKISHIGPILGVHYVFTTDTKDSINDIDIFTTKVLMHNLNDNDEIVNYPGRFYLKNKNNDIILGQSASSDYVYNESNEYIPSLDTSLEFIDNVGRVIKRENKININDKININNTELNNILMYISNLSNNENNNINQLFMNKLSDYKTVATLMKNYNLDNKKYVVKPIVGEYENLYIHRHNILQINLTNKNSLIYSIDQYEYETFISTMLFSSMYLYTPEEVNYYLVDFNSGMLSSYKQSPLVGDIVNNNEIVKIENLFKLIDLKIEERSELFKEYGNYDTYIRKTNNMIPLLVIIINNYSLFSSKCSKYIYNLNKLLDYKDYGISVLISNDKLINNDISSKMDQVFALKLNSNKLYKEIFEEDISNYPEPYIGRGLTKIDGNICEFQVGYANPKCKLFENFVEKQCIECSKEYKKGATDIPVLPDRLTLKHVKHEIGKTREMIIGYNSNLKLIKYDFDDKNTTIICGKDYNTINKFTKPLIKQFAYLNRNDVIVFDALNNFSDFNINNIKHVNCEFDDNFELLQDYINNIYSMNKDSNGYYNLEKHRTIFINGICKLYDELKEENKLKFIELINKSNNLDIVNFIIIDSLDNQYNIISNSWYKQLVQQSDCIWVGKGICNQNLISVLNNIENNIKDNYCYIISSGIPTLTQYVESFDISE